MASRTKRRGCGNSLPCPASTRCRRPLASARWTRCWTSRPRATPAWPALLPSAPPRPRLLVRAVFLCLCDRDFEQTSILRMPRVCCVPFGRCYFQCLSRWTSMFTSIVTANTFSAHASDAPSRSLSCVVFVPQGGRTAASPAAPACLQPVRRRPVAR